MTLGVAQVVLISVASSWSPTSSPASVQLEWTGGIKVGLLFFLFITWLVVVVVVALLG
jgi:hypothetical protein